MVVISKTILVNFGNMHADSIGPLNTWYKLIKRGDWGSYNELRDLFPGVDYVGNDRFVFNVKGNKYRIVAMIFFDIRTVFIRFVGTHLEYNKTDCRIV